MKVQVYALGKDELTWEPDGYLSLDGDELSLDKVKTERTLRRVTIFIEEHQDDADKEGFLRNLSSVFYVPFCRFGDIIEDSDTNEKEEDDETI